MGTQSRYLFASNFDPDPDAGAAGSLLAVAEQLEKRGHCVDFLWSPSGKYHLRHARLRELLELPRLFQRQLENSFAKQHYDFVIASQPHSYRGFDWLRKHHPQTILVNRTHGWEPRAASENKKLQWRRQQLLPRLLSGVSQNLRDAACRRVVRASHGIIASSNLCANYIRQSYCLPPNGVTVIPHGVSHFMKRRDEESSGGRMLFVGQYLARKGSMILDNLLPGILNEFPGATMTFVVPGESVEGIKNTFAGYGSERVVVLPWMAREKLFDIYQANDILLYPSLFEGFGKVFLEGMASGLCVAGFAEGAMADVATRGLDALFAAAGKTKELCDLIRWALRHPDQVRSIGKAAIETARQYTWEMSAQKTDQYCQLLKAVARERYAFDTWMAPVGQLSAASIARWRSFGPGTIFRTATLSSSSSKSSGAEPTQAAAPMQRDRSIVTVRGIHYS